MKELINRGIVFVIVFSLKKEGNKLPDTIDQLLKHTIYRAKMERDIRKCWNWISLDYKIVKSC